MRCKVWKYILSIDRNEFQTIQNCKVKQLYFLMKLKFLNKYFKYSNNNQNNSYLCLRNH